MIGGRTGSASAAILCFGTQGSVGGAALPLLVGGSRGATAATMLIKVKVFPFLGAKTGNFGQSRGMLVIHEGGEGIWGEIRGFEAGLEWGGGA